MASEEPDVVFIYRTTSKFLDIFRMKTYVKLEKVHAVCPPGEVQILLVKLEVLIQL